MKRKVRQKGIRVSLKNLEGDRKRIAKCKTGDGENKGVSGVVLAEDERNRGRAAREGEEEEEEEVVGEA